MSTSVADAGIPQTLLGRPIVEWAEENILLPALTPQPGPLKLTGPERAILSAYADPDVRQITMMMANQVGKSLVLLVILGYHMAESPMASLLVMPTMAVRDRFFKQKFEPLVNSTPVINRVVQRTERKAIPTDTVLYEGGEIHTAYSGSATSLETVTVRYVLADECDGYRFLIDGQHPIDALHPRIATFGRWGKLVLASVPSREVEDSIIARECDKGSGGWWYISCPHCVFEHTIEWENIREARLYCPSCGAEISDRERLERIDAGRYIEERPNPTHKSFHLSQLYSHLIPLSEIAAILPEGRMTKRGFTTRVLGIPYKANALAPLAEDDLRGLYQMEYSGRVSAITAAVDVQKDRLEYQVVSWSRMFPRVVVHKRIFRAPGDKPKAVWRAAYKAIARFQPDMVFVDVGGVYRRSEGGRAALFTAFCYPQETEACERVDASGVRWRPERRPDPATA